MTNFLNDPRRTTFLLSLLCVIAATIMFAFYWYEWRPSHTRQTCASWALEKAEDKANDPDRKYASKDLDHYYHRCLREHGLEQ